MELLLHSNEVLKRRLRTVFNRLHDSKCSPKSGECCFYAWIQKCTKEFDEEDEYGDNNNNNNNFNNNSDDDDVDEGDNAWRDYKEPSYVDLIILWKSGRLDLNDCHHCQLENHGVVSVKVDELVLVNDYLESFCASHSVKDGDGASFNDDISLGCDEKRVFYPCSHGSNVGFGWILCTEQFKFFRIVDNYYYHQFHPSGNPSICKFSGIRKSCTLCCDSPALVSLFLIAVLFLLLLLYKFASLRLYSLCT